MSIRALAAEYKTTPSKILPLVLKRGLICYAKFRLQWAVVPKEALEFHAKREIDDPLESHVRSSLCFAKTITFHSGHTFAFPENRNSEWVNNSNSPDLEIRGFDKVFLTKADIEILKLEIMAARRGSKNHRKVNPYSTKLQEAVTTAALNKITSIREQKISSELKKFTYRGRWNKRAMGRFLSGTDGRKLLLAQGLLEDELPESGTIENLLEFQKSLPVPLF